MTRDEIIQAIHKERERQEWLHPEWHGLDHGMGVLGEEYGEVCKAVNEINRLIREKLYLGLEEVPNHESRLRVNQRGLNNWNANLDEELIQVGAVVFRWLENR